MITTQGIRYSGSKKSIIGKILKMIPGACNNILDGCSGTTRVSQALKLRGYNVDCNDLSEYSKIFGLCYIKNNLLDYDDLIEHLNNVSPIDGWISQNYGGLESEEKKNWLIKNTRKADGIREEIERINLSETEKSVAITSLILALDKIANNLGHQVSFLREWAPRCKLDLELQVPILISGTGKYEVLQQDIRAINKKYDLAYLDIPYGTNNTKHLTTRVRYSSYYNIWTSICKWDKPKLFGAAKRREDCSDKVVGALSDFENTNYEVVFRAIEDTIQNLNTSYIIFSYNNKGKISIGDLENLFSKYGEVSSINFGYKENVQKSLTSNKEFLGDQSANLEYLFLIEKF